MKSKLFVFMMILISWTAKASRDCDENVCQHERSLEVIKDKAADLTFSNSQDPSCPAGGIELIESSQNFEGSLLKAQGFLLQLQTFMNKEKTKVSLDQTKCGDCKQKNLVTTVSISRPKAPQYSSICENRSTEGFQKEFESSAEAVRYSKAVMDGKNKEGQLLRSVCPDPCSYYVYTGETPLPSKNVRLSLVVRCGQPRGSLFATYLYSAALVKQWTCAP